MKLIIRADDLGYSEAVNYGIEKSVKDGIVRSVGLMPNMPTAAHGLKLLQGTGICMGQHTNLCLGKPCADPRRIPSLLDENGNLKNSKIYREAQKSGKEVAPLEEFIIEIEAQYRRFRELTGHEPGYFEAHAVISKNLYKGLEIVAERYGLKYFFMNPDGSSAFCGKPVSLCPMGSMTPDYNPWQCLQDAVRGADRKIPAVYICHPGYLDDYLLRNSSLTINRTKEVVMLCDPAMKSWLDKHDVEIVSYGDL